MESVGFAAIEIEEFEAPLPIVSPHIAGTAVKAADASAPKTLSNNQRMRIPVLALATNLQGVRSAWQGAQVEVNSHSHGELFQRPRSPP